jgi:hypothetical protein
MELHLNRPPNDTIHMSGFGGEVAVVAELDICYLLLFASSSSYTSILKMEAVLSSVGRLSPDITVLHPSHRCDNHRSNFHTGYDKELHKFPVLHL